MALFSQKPDNLIGLELGSSAIKVVELRRDDTGPQLVTYGSGVHDQIDVRNNAQADTNHIVTTIKEVLSKARVTTDRTVVSLPAMNVFHTTVEIPVMNKKDMTSAVQWEAKRLLPMPLEKMALDWHLLSGTPTEKNTLPIILTAAPRDVVNHYVSIMKEAGLILVGLETEINALQRSIIPSTPDNYALIDMGASNTNTVIFSHSAPTLVRNINVGSTALSTNIASTMNVSIERATSIRQELGLTFAAQGQHPGAGSIRFVMETMIIKEIRRVLSAFTQPITKAFLTGGAAHLPGAVEYFSTQLGLPMEIGNPWSQIHYQPGLEQTLQRIGPEMAVAVGLALRTKKPVQ